MCKFRDTCGCIHYKSTHFIGLLQMLPSCLSRYVMEPDVPGGSVHHSLLGMAHVRGDKEVTLIAHCMWNIAPVHNKTAPAYCSPVTI